MKMAYKGVMKVVADGTEMELYTIGHTAKILRKSVETIRAWERQKIIPRPMYKSGKVRLYHPIEVEAMRKVLRKLGRYAKKDKVQKEMWAALKAARYEIRNGKAQNEDNTDMHSTGVSDPVQQGTE